MSEKQHQNPPDPSHHVEGYAGSPTTQQMRTVGQRRRDAEEKLEQHLEEARHKDTHHHDTPQEEGARKETENTKQEQADAVESPDVAAIQNDDALTAADRVDLIANQVVPETGDNGDKPETSGKP